MCLEFLVLGPELLKLQIQVLVVLSETLDFLAQNFVLIEKVLLLKEAHIFFVFLCHDFKLTSKISQKWFGEIPLRRGFPKFFQGFRFG